MKLIAEAPGENLRNLSLDGLRGVAVLLVLLCHHHYLNAGWMGVDLFFVLSGYLITSILRSSRTSNHFWRSFWTKRCARILPPFLVLLVATSLFGFGSSRIQTLGYLFSFGDVLAYVRPTFQSLRALWSLAVEEHYYLIWPFAVRFLPRRSLLIMLCSLIVLEPTVRAIASGFTHDWQVIYFLTPFRLDGLALGSLLALWMEMRVAAHLLEKWSSWMTLLFSATYIGCRILFGLNFTRSNPTAIYNSACYSLVSLAAFSLIAYLISHPGSSTARLLKWKPLVFTGAISYGLYLYQELVLQMVRRQWDISDRQALWVDAPIIFLVSWLSFRFYERPIARWVRTKAAAEGGLFPVEVNAVSSGAVLDHSPRPLNV